MKNLTKKQLLFLSKVYELNDITNVMGHIKDMVEKQYVNDCIEQFEEYYNNNN